MPASLRRPTASVTFPNGTKGDIPNPLREFNFHPLKSEFFSILVSPLWVLCSGGLTCLEMLESDTVLGGFAV